MKVVIGGWSTVPCTYVHLYVCIYLYDYINSHVYLDASVCLCLCVLSDVSCLSVCLAIYLCINLSVNQFIYLSIYLPICLFLYLDTSDKDSVRWILYCKRDFDLKLVLPKPYRALHDGSQVACLSRGLEGFSAADLLFSKVVM